jgi:hypothetical protein
MSDLLIALVVSTLLSGGDYIVNGVDSTGT